MRPHRGRLGRRLAAGSATVLLLVLLAGLGAAMLPRAVGYRTLLVRSGSMGDSAPTGSLVVARPVPAGEVRVGTVIVMRPGAHSKGLPTLHRVVSRGADAAHPVVATKGDANDDIDPNPYPLDGRTPIAVAVVPYLGYLVGTVSAPVGWGLLVVALAVLITAWFAAPPGPPAQPTRPTRTTRMGKHRRVLVVGVWCLAMLTPTIQWTNAQFGDSALARSSFSTGMFGEGGGSGGTGGTCRNPNVASVWFTGFEHGVVSVNGGGLLTAITGTPAIDTVVRRTGSYSLKIDPAGAAEQVTRDLTGSPTVVVERVALKLPTLPAASVRLLNIEAAGSDASLEYDAVTGKLEVRLASGASIDGGEPTPGSWQLVDIRFNVGASPRTIDWRLNGADQPPLSAAEAAGTIARLQFGTASADVFTANYDDIMVSQTAADYPLGEGEIWGLRPDGAGNHQLSTYLQNDDGTALDATTAGRLDDAPLSSTADYVQQVTDQTSAFAEVTFADTTEPCVQELSAVVAYHSEATQGNNGQTQITSGGTTTVVHSGDMSESSLFYKSAIVNRSGQWSASDVNNVRARVGFSSDARPVPYWDALVLEVAVIGDITCVSGNATETYLTGFEHGSVDAAGGGLYTTVSIGDGTITADGTVNRNGDYSLKVAKTAGTAPSYIEEPGFSGGTAIGRFAVRLESLTPARARLATVTAGSGADELHLDYEPSTGRFEMAFGGGASSVGATNVVAGTWYVIEFKVVYNTNPRTADWRIDGSDQPQAALATTTTTGRRLRLGSDIAADVFTANYDDVILSTTTAEYPLGDGKVLALRPDGMGSHNAPASFQHEDGTPIDANTFTRIDDNPMGSTADYLKQMTAGSGSQIVFTLADTIEPCINAVRVITAYHSAAGGTPPNNGRTLIGHSGSGTITQSGDMSATVLTYRGSVVNPLTSPWSNTGVNQLTATLGNSTDVDPNPYWDALLLEYNAKL